ncbi:MAG: L,D-transpeptidase family protein [Pseudomonadota bacterium]|nr:L,D-transpeptidase family protein [Pseudomonadota bacterium]
MKLSRIFLLLFFLIFSPYYLFASTFHINSSSDLVGSIQYHRIVSGDSWNDLCYYYGVGYDELRAANPKIESISANTGRTLVIPSLYLLPSKKYRNGIVVNLAEKRLYFFLDPHTVLTYPVSIGKSAWETPTFYASVRGKKVAPSWYVPKSIKEYMREKYDRELPDVVEPGPDNPLGNYAIYLTKPGILIHGTNNESRHGSAISAGCVRMYNRDIQELFFLVGKSAPVYFIHQDEKIGIHENAVFYEKHSAYNDDDFDMVYFYLDSLQKQHEFMLIDKDLLKDVHDFERGIPIQIGVIE